MTTPATTPLLRLKQVQALVPLHRVTLWRLMLDGSFPAPLKIGKRAIAWRADDVQAWLDSRTNGRGEAQ